MASIEVKVANEKDLTVFSVEGSITADEILGSKTKYYYIKEPTRHVIWDFSNGTAEKISSHEFQVLAHQMKPLSIMRRGGKTAIVAKKDIDFGLGRMYTAYATVEKLPINYRVFRDIEDATYWIYQKEN